MTRNVKKARKEKKLRQNVNLSDLEMIVCGTNAKNVEINLLR